MLVVESSRPLDLASENEYTLDLLSACIEGRISGVPRSGIVEAIEEIHSPFGLSHEEEDGIRQYYVDLVMSSFKPMTGMFIEYCCEQAETGFDLEFGLELKQIDPYSLVVSMR